MSEVDPPNSGNGFQTSQPKTFTGDRGGSAHDDDLLAELRAISAKSGSANRFKEDEVDSATGAEDNVISPPSAAPSSSTQSNDEKALPPWKRKVRKTKSVNKVDALDNVAIKVPDANAESISASEPEKVCEVDPPILGNALQPSQPKT